MKKKSLKKIDKVTFDAVIKEYQKCEHIDYHYTKAFYRILPFWKKWFCDEPREPIAAHNFRILYPDECHKD